MSYKKSILLLILFISVSVSSVWASTKKVPASKRVVVAYVTSGSSSIPDTKLITHINYAFGHVNNTFDGIRIDNEARLHEIASLKKENKALKIFISIGGWGSGNFSEMAADKKKRETFAMDCMRVLKEFNIDGIDIDWEYPTSKSAEISASAEDTENYTLMMQDIRKAIGNDKLLTLASAANAKYIDFKAIMPVVDFVNIMSYDMSQPPHHHAPLHPSPQAGRGSCQKAVEDHLKQGVPADKLVLGVPFYGRGNKEVGVAINYKQLIELKGYKQTWDKQAKSAYLSDTDGTMVCSFDNAKSIAEKARFVRKNGLLGMMYWQYDGDDAKGTLRKAVYKGTMKR